MAPGASVAYLPQAPVIPPGMTLRSVVIAGHDADWLGRPVPIHKAEEFLQRLGLDPDRLSDGLSGGEARRVSLARALYTEPDVLLSTSRPTIWTCRPSNGWRRCCAGTAARFWWSATTAPSFATLAPASSGCNGKLRRREGDFAQFDDWSEGILAEEAVVLHKMDPHRRRDEMVARGHLGPPQAQPGRLRELEALRLERARTGGITQRAMKMETGPAEGGGQLVLEAIDLSISVPLPPTEMTGSGDDEDARRAAPAAEPFQHAGPAKRPHRHCRAERHRQIDLCASCSAMPSRMAGGSARASASTRPISTSSAARSTAIPRPGPCSPAAAAT